MPADTLLEVMSRSSQTRAYECPNQMHSEALDDRAMASAFTSSRQPLESLDGDSEADGDPGSEDGQIGRGHPDPG
jgi:hypothetical protein